MYVKETQAYLLFSHQPCPLTNSSSILHPNSLKNKSNNFICPLKISLVAQLVKNPSAMQKTPVPFLVSEDLLEKG